MISWINMGIIVTPLVLTDERLIVPDAWRLQFALSYSIRVLPWPGRLRVSMNNQGGFASGLLYPVGSAHDKPDPGWIWRAQDKGITGGLFRQSLFDDCTGRSHSQEKLNADRFYVKIRMSNSKIKLLARNKNPTWLNCLRRAHPPSKFWDLTYSL